MTAELQCCDEAIDVARAQASAVVVGLGKTGMSCVRFLADHGYHVKVVDSRTTPPMKTQFTALHPNVPLHIGFEPELMADADIVVVSPGISIHEPAIQQVRERGVEVAGDVELFARHVRAPIIAVTGSNGKSTVTALIGEMCRVAGLDAPLGGNIGVPVLDLLTSAERVPDWYVLELSSFQLETTSSLRPKAAAVLNVSPDHMDRYPDLNAYTKAKARIFHGAGVAVVNRDDPATLALVPPQRSTCTFGCSAPQRDDELGLIAHGGTWWLVRGAEKLMPREQVPLFGGHNLENVMAAMALASVAGVSSSAMVHAVRHFAGLRHRAEMVLAQDGIRWVNDSKATNVGATVAALKGCESPVILIAGGDGKAADFFPLRNVVAQHVRAAVLFGQDAANLEAVVDDVTHCHRVKTLRDAVQVAGKLARAGDVVMLSPACASFDMFENFEQRGDVFCSLVKELAA